MDCVKRIDGRTTFDLREISFEAGVAPFSLGSVLVKFGTTQVICAVNVEKRIPHWMIKQNISGGWLTAEYSLLPYSTPTERKQREITKGKPDSRTVEIQRLIGRSLRAVCNLSKVHGLTFWVDCDVLQADGGTRTASISGSYVAMKMAINRLMKDKVINKDPFVDSIAAVSVGIVREIAMIDLNYSEDKDASVDFNVVMTGSGKFVELQGAGEESTFDDTQLANIISLAKTGIKTISEKQKEAIDKFI